MMRRPVLVLLACLIAASSASAPAQQNTPLMPFIIPVTVGTSPAQVIGQNNARKRIVFVNPNATATIAVCPLFRRDTSAAITCAVNGAGSITILPYGSFQLDGIGGNPLVPTGWNGVASAGGSALSIFEYE